MLYVVHRMSYVVYRMSYVVHRMSYVLVVSYVVYRMSYVVCSMSRVTCHRLLTQCCDEIMKAPTGICRKESIPPPNLAWLR